MNIKSANNKSSSITAKIDGTLKSNVEKILDRLGLNHSQVINMLYNQIELTNSIPFNLVIPEKTGKNTINSNKSKGIKK